MPRRSKLRPFYGAVLQNGAAYGATLPANASFAVGQRSYTIDAWIRCSSSTLADGNTHAILNLRNGLLVSQFGSTIYVYHSGVIRHTDTTTLAGRANRWLHITIVGNYAAQTITTYLDGEQTSQTTGVPLWNIANDQCELGKGTFNGLLAGSILARERVWVDLAMSAAEVARLHYDDVEPSVPQIDAQWREMTGTTMSNLGSSGGSFTLTSANMWISDIPPIQILRPKQNLYRYSNDLSNAAWEKVTVNVTLSPYTHPLRPGQPVWRVAATTTVYAHAIRQLNLISFYSAAAPLKGKAIRQRFLARQGSQATLNFDFGTYTWATGAWAITANAWMVLSYIAIPLGNSWYEFIIDYSSDLYKGYGVFGEILLPNIHDPSNYVDLCDLSAREVTASNDYVETTSSPAITNGEVGGAVSPQNLIVNSGAAASWLPLNADASAQPDGSIRVTERSNNAEHIVYQTPPGNQIAGALHTITVKAKAGSRTWLWIRGPQGGSRNDSAYFDLTNGVVGNVNSLAQHASIASLGDGWYLCSVSFWTTINSQYAVCIGPASANGTYAYLGNGTGYIDFKDAQLTQSAGVTDFIATNGIQTYGNPQRALRSPQNLFSYSNDLTNAAWSRSQLSSVTALGAVGPSETQAFRLTDNSVVDAYHSIAQNSTPVAVGSVVTFGVFARPGTKSRISMQTASGSIAAVFNLVTFEKWIAGGRYVQNLLGYGIEDAGNSWTYCWMTFIVGGNTPTSMVIYMVNVDGIAIPAYTGDGTGTIDLAAPTLNEAKGPSAFISTSSAVVKGAVPRGRRGKQNLVARSEDLTLSPWVDISGGLNFALSASVDPYGGQVTRLYNATKNGFRAQYVPYKAQGVQYTFAALVKYVAGSGYVMFRHSGTWTVFDVKNGGFGSTSIDTFSTRVLSRGITLISDGWYLCWYSYLAPGPTSVYVGICPSTSTGGATTNDWDVLVGRVQLTEGNYGVPYVRTIETDTDEGAPRTLGT